jgi:hypothetical protein
VLSRNSEDQDLLAFIYFMFEFEYLYFFLCFKAFNGRECIIDTSTINTIKIFQIKRQSTIICKKIYFKEIKTTEFVCIKFFETDINRYGRYAPDILLPEHMSHKNFIRHEIISG